MDGNDLFIKQLQFYADKEHYYSNKLFTFAVQSKEDCFRLLLKFAVNGNEFRKAWFNQKIVIANKKHVVSDDLFLYVRYFNSCEYDKPPTLQEALHDFQMYAYG